MIKRLLDIVELNYGTYRGMIRSWLSQIEWIFGGLDCWTEVDFSNVKRFVFVCQGNINRSAFAEFVARRHGLHSISIGLATTTGAPAWRVAMTQGALLGYNLSSHRATDIKDYKYTDGDLLLAMEVRHARRLVRMGIPKSSIAMLGYWATPRRIHLHDPYQLPDKYFASCFVMIESAVRNISQRLDECKLPH